MTYRELVVDDQAAVARLDVYLAASMSITRSAAAKLLQGGHVSVNGNPGRASYLVQVGDHVAVNEPPVEDTPSPQVPRLPVMYEDEDILVIDKPAGIAAHPGAGTAGEATVADFACTRSTDPDPERPGIVHRLDRDTSGLMIIAKTVAAKAYMQRQFQERNVHKMYELLVVGRVTPPQAIIKLPLDRDPAHPLRRAVVAGGRPAVTKYRTVADYPGYTLIQAEPQTGRTHQLRVHFAAIGHPIVGDQLYGTRHTNLKLDRQFLHAASLKFTAPSGKHLDLKSDLPPDLTDVVHSLEKRL